MAWNSAKEKNEWISQNDLFTYGLKFILFREKMIIKYSKNNVNDVAKKNQGRAKSKNKVKVIFSNLAKNNIISNVEYFYISIDLKEKTVFT